MSAADEIRMNLARADKLADLASWGNNGNPKASRLAVRCILRATDALDRLEEEREQMLAALRKVVASAVPHPVEHKAMTEAWEIARATIAKAEESEVPR